MNLPQYKPFERSAFGFSFKVVKSLHHTAVDTTNNIILHLGFRVTWTQRTYNQVLKGPRQNFLVLV